MAETQTTTPAPIDVRFVIPITKVDREQRLIKGIATQEVVDDQGDKVDYESAKAAFGQWKGNIREMHGLKAVGKAVDVEFDDEAKAITVTSYISKGAPDTWEKICDGTLGCYSIGGKGVRSFIKATEASKPNVKIVKMTELSVVDAGAVPTSKFDILKAATDDVIESVQPAEPEEKPADPPAPNATKDAPATEVAKVSAADLRALLALPAADRIAKAATIGTDQAPIEVDIQKRVESYDIRNALQCLAWLEELVASELYESEAMKANGALTPEQSAQVELLKNAAELVLAFLMGEFLAQFDDAAKKADVTKADVDATRVAVLKTLGATVGPQVKSGRAFDAIVKAMHAAAEVLQPQLVPIATATLEATEPVALVKLQTQLDTTAQKLAAAEELIQKQQGLLEGLATLEERLKVIEAQPAGGGPVARALTPVAKTVGGEEGVPADHTANLKVFEDLAKVAKTPQEREFIAQNLLAYQFKHGLGGTAVSR